MRGGNAPGPAYGAHRQAVDVVTVLGDDDGVLNARIIRHGGLRATRRVNRSPDCLSGMAAVQRGSGNGNSRLVRASDEGKVVDSERCVL